MYARSPMRISFGGGNTDVSPYRENCGGVCLGMAINKYAYASVADNGKVESPLISAIRKKLGYNDKLEVNSEAKPFSGLGASGAMAISAIGLITNGRMDKKKMAHLAFEVEREDLCFPVNTKILIDKEFGKENESNRFNVLTRNIEDIKVGDMVLSYNEETGVKENKRVTNVMERECGDFVKISFDNDNFIECTPEHPVAIVDNGRIKWIEAKELAVGNKCIQHMYTGLNLRRNNYRKRGKTVEEFYGIDKGTEIRESVREARLIDWQNEEYVESMNSKIYVPRTGKTLVEIYGEEKANEITNGNREKQFELLKDSGYVKRQKQGCIDKWNDEEWAKNTKQSLRDSKFGKTIEEIVGSEEYGREIRKKHRENTIRRLLENTNPDGSYMIKKSKLEERFEEALKEICPSEFKYNGDGSAGIVISGHIPDFVNVNGKKKLIEVDGCFFHSCEQCYGHDEDIAARDLKRVEDYDEAGFETLVIWEHEINSDIEAVKCKVEKFIFNPNIEVVEVRFVEFLEGDNEPVYNLEVEDNNNYFAHGILVHNCIKGGFQDQIFACHPAGTNVLTSSNSQKNVPIDECACGCGEKLTGVIEVYNSLMLRWFNANSYLITYHTGNKEEFLLKTKNKHKAEAIFVECKNNGSFKKNVCFSVSYNRGHAPKVIPKKIEDILEEDMVLSYNIDEGKKEYCKVSKTFKRRGLSIATLYLSNNNRLKITEEHPVAVINKNKIEWKNVKDLKIGDILFQIKYPALGLRTYNFSEIENGNRSKITKDLWEDPTFREKTSASISKAQKGRSEEISDIVKKWHKTKKRDNPRMFEYYSKNMNIPESPNKKELSLSNLLEQNFEGEFEINVKGEVEDKLDIGFHGLRPDFVNINGKKKVIEFFGCYWHDCPVCQRKNGYLSSDKEFWNKLTKLQEWEQAIKHYSEIGYDCLVIWEHELDKRNDEGYVDNSVLENKINEFIFNPGSELVTVEKILWETTNEDVYNLEVENNNNYFAEGILVHNCFGGFQYLEFGKDRFSILPMTENGFSKQLEDNCLIVYVGPREDNIMIHEDEAQRTKENTETLDVIKELANDMRFHARRGNFGEFAELLHRAWLEKRKLSSLVSTPVIDEYYDEVLKHGALGGKLAGAGGGGHMMLICEDPKKVWEVSEKMGYHPEKVKIDWEGVKVYK